MAIERHEAERPLQREQFVAFKPMVDHTEKVTERIRGYAGKYPSDRLRAGLPAPDHALESTWNLKLSGNGIQAAASHDRHDEAAEPHGPSRNPRQSAQVLEPADEGTEVEDLLDVRTESPHHERRASPSLRFSFAALRRLTHSAELVSRHSCAS